MLSQDIVKRDNDLIYFIKRLPSKSAIRELAYYALHRFRVFGTVGAAKEVALISLAYIPDACIGVLRFAQIKFLEFILSI